MMSLHWFNTKKNERMNLCRGFSSFPAILGAPYLFRSDTIEWMSSFGGCAGAGWTLGGDAAGGPCTFGAGGAIALGCHEVLFFLRDTSSIATTRIMMRRTTPASRYDP